MKWMIVSAVVLTTSQLFPAPVIFGEYIEARAPVSWLTSPGEGSDLRATGELALLGWIVERGIWDGVDLNGLNIALAVRAAESLSPRNAATASAIIYIDERASKDQEKALISMARSLAGKWLQNIVDTRRAQITFARKDEDSILQVGREVRINIRHAHHACDLQLEGEPSAEPPLATMEHPHSVEIESCEYRVPGIDLGSLPSRSAVVGEFSL